jgi:GNAT superfamily N-acetyltransferase
LEEGTEMNAYFTVQKSSLDDVNEVAVMVGELLNEIMCTIGVQAFNFNLEETTARLREFIEQDKYFVFVAQSTNTGPIGFVTLSESHALYAAGTFGIIQEFYVRPEFRSQNVGLRLMEQVTAFGKSRGWTRLEVTTPPLPQFQKTLAFYEREDFAITGGRKLRRAL